MTQDVGKWDCGVKKMSSSASTLKGGRANLRNDDSFGRILLKLNHEV